MMRLRPAVTVLTLGLVLGLQVTTASTALAMPGALDVTFSSDGKQTADFFGSHWDRAYGVAVQGNGKVVVAGETRSTSNGTFDFALARYTEDGDPDTSFSSDGRQTTGFGRGGVPFDDGAKDVAVQPDGKVVAVRYSGPVLRGVPLHRKRHTRRSLQRGRQGDP